MNFPKNSPLGEGQVSNPVLWSTTVRVGSLAGFVRPPFHVFGPPSHKPRLVTWGRDEENPLYAPHWIGVRSGTPLHTDPRYPRYTHQLSLGTLPFRLFGFDGVETPVNYGTFLCCDTHSPHQILGPRGDFYIAVSLDAHEPLDPFETLERLINYLMEEGESAYYGTEVSGDASVDGGREGEPQNVDC